MYTDHRRYFLPFLSLVNVATSFDDLKKPVPYSRKSILFPLRLERFSLPKDPSRMYSVEGMMGTCTKGTDG